MSATGALVRTEVPFEEGRYCPMILNLPDAPASLSVRIVRSEPAPAAPPGGHARAPQYLVAVRFAEVPAPARHAIATLCRTGHSQRD